MNIRIALAPLRQDYEEDQARNASLPLSVAGDGYESCIPNIRIALAPLRQDYEEVLARLDAYRMSENPDITYRVGSTYFEERVRLTKTN